MPKPASFLSTPGIPMAVVCKAARISSGPAFGRFSKREATTPLTFAAAKEVPDSVP